MANKSFRKFLSNTNPFQQYLYSYPHKSAYRTLEREIDLQELWSKEKKDSLYLYTHIPFCRSKCSFCNLFSVSNSNSEKIDSYLNTLRQEAEVTKHLLGNHSFSGYAIGGGTPSILSTSQLENLFQIYSESLDINLKELPGSFELSPDTVTSEKLDLIHNAGIDRVSIGVQSFIEEEAKLMGRKQPGDKLQKVLNLIRSYNFTTFNIDLIYGIKGQTKESMIKSLETAMTFNPNEIFLYPLYTRPLTPLFSKSSAGEQDEDHRMELYMAAREFLFERGFEQNSMRMFSRDGDKSVSSYSCQEDGMIGLGVNARSYTKRIHYSTEYAVSKKSSLGIIDQYISQEKSDFSTAVYGIELNSDEQKRRYIIKSLLKAEGLNLEHYESLYKKDALKDFDELITLIDMKLALADEGQLKLNGEGLALSDLIGYWFISDEIKGKMREYTLR